MLDDSPTLNTGFFCIMSDASFEVQNVSADQCRTAGPDDDLHRWSRNFYDSELFENSPTTGMQHWTRRIIVYICSSQKPCFE